MANISAADVKRLREATGAGMMDCKKALEENDGEFDKAVEYLRVKGQKGVAKREGRNASNGLVAVDVASGVGTMVEVNCETDFVAKGEAFKALADQVLAQAVAIAATDADSLLKSELEGGRTVQQVIDDANATIGEKIVVRRVARVEAPVVVSYLHRTSPDLPPQIGVLVGAETESQTVHDVALHVAAMAPTYLDRSEIAEEVIATERRVAEATAREEGKPEAALPKIVEGRVNGFFKENVLLEQAFAKDSKKTVAAVVKDAGITLTGFARYRVGA
ncbi:MAG: translation elongation factor Ts [Kineosporiaceae bacterium]